MPRHVRRRGFTLIELMIVVAIIGILAAIAIPNFIRFQARSKQGEAKANLKALFSAQRSYHQEKDKYVEAIHTIGFAPERGNRYYYISGTGPNENRQVAPAVITATDSGVTVDVFKYTTALPAPASPKATAQTWYPVTGGATPPAGTVGGVNGACPICEFVGYAYGNIDNETTGIDAWYVSSVDSANTPYRGSLENVPAGQPQNTYNDVVLDD